jgi:predicted RNA-binding Zn-ribbon protein involved in translation (DUF1610 family)
MSKEMQYDTATGVALTNDAGSTSFPCPKCGETIRRSRQSRAVSIKYTCKACGFEGPN